MKKNEQYYTMLTRKSQLDAPFGALEGWQKASLLRQIESRLGDEDLAKKICDLLIADPRSIREAEKAADGLNLNFQVLGQLER